MTRRYFVPQLPEQGGTIALPEDEALHAARVMRAQIGDAVIAFAGDGRESQGSIASVDRKRVFVSLRPPQTVSRESAVSISVAVSLPKGDRGRTMIEKLTELGVARVIPIVCARTQAGSSESAIDKLRRVVIEASKQCERNRLLEITSPQSFCEFLDQQSAGPEPSLALIAHPDGHSFAATAAADPLTTVHLLIGPEGGFTAEEVERAIDRGWQRVSLGPRILRIETAAVATVARLVLA